MKYFDFIKIKQIVKDNNFKDINIQDHYTLARILYYNKGGNVYFYYRNRYNLLYPFHFIKDKRIIELFIRSSKSFNGTCYCYVTTMQINLASDIDNHCLDNQSYGCRPDKIVYLAYYYK